MSNDNQIHLGFPMPFKRLYSLTYEPSAKDDYSFLSPESQERIQQIVLSLPDFDKNLVCMRVGYYAPEVTLEELGKSFGITKEAVRQRQNRVFAKLQKRFRQEIPELCET